LGHAKLEEAAQGNASLMTRLHPASAEAAAVKPFGLDDEQRKRLAVRVKD
jgi:hypothetical protein